MASLVGGRGYSEVCFEAEPRSAPMLFRSEVNRTVSLREKFQKVKLATDGDFLCVCFGSEMNTQ